MPSLIARALDRAEHVLESTRIDCREAVKSGGLGGALSQSSGTIAGASFGRYTQSQAHHADQYSYFTGYPYSIINIIANRLAAQPIRVARVLPQGERARKKLRPKSKELVPKSMHEMMHRMEILQDHRILRVLEKPNPMMVRHNLLYMTFASPEITGFGYWWIYYDKQEGRDYIWPVPTHWIEPVHEQDKLFAYYRVQLPGTGEPIKVPTHQIVRFYFPDPSDPFAAYAPLQANARTVMTDFAIEMAQRMGFENGINPGLAIMVGKPPEFAGVGGDQMVLTDTQRNQIVAAVKRQYRGVTRFDEPLILDALIKDVKPITTTPREMAFKESSVLSRNRLTQGWGMNPITMGEIEGVNYASSGVADHHVCRNVYHPRTEANSQTMTAGLVPYFGDGEDDLVVYQEPVQPSDPELDLNRDYGDYDRGIISRNELRQKRGRPPIANGNFAYVGGNDQGNGGGWVEVDPHGEETGNPADLGPEVEDQNPDPDDEEGGNDADERRVSRLSKRRRRGKPGRPFHWWNWGAWDSLDARLREKTGESLADTVVKAAAVIDDQMKHAEKSWRKQLAAVFAKLGAAAAHKLREAVSHGNSVSPAETAHAAVNRTQWEREIGVVMEAVLSEAALSGAAAEWHLFRASRAERPDKGWSLPKRVLDAAKAVVRSVMEKGIVRTIVDGVINAVRRCVRKVQGAGKKGEELAAQVANEVLVGAAAEQAAKTVARTNAKGAVNAGQHAVRQDLIRGGAVAVTEWVTEDDEKVRTTHAKAHGQRVRPGHEFHVGGHKCYYPGDLQLPIGERVNCRCKSITIYVPK